MNKAAYSMIVVMAIRNLFRHRVKSIITILAIIVSVSAFVIMDSWLHGMNLDSKRNIVNYEIGSVKIQTRDYFENRLELPMYENFSGWEKIGDVLEKNGYRYAPRFVFTGTLYSQDGSAPILCNAVDAKREKEVLSYWRFIEYGNFIENGTREIMLGMMVAEKLRIGIPSKIAIKDFETDYLSLGFSTEEKYFIQSLYTEDTQYDGRLVLKKEISESDIRRFWKILFDAGKMNVRISTTIDIKDELGVIRHVNQLIDAVVVGIINSPNPQTNGNIAYIPLDSLQDENGLLLEGKITEIVVRSKSSTDDSLPGKTESSQYVDSVLRHNFTQAGDQFPQNLVINEWVVYVQDYLAAAAGDTVSTRIMAFFLFMLSFIGIANTMLMAILERTKEIGMLRALGMKDSQLILLYMTEAAFIGFIGSSLGIIISVIVNIPLINIGVDYSSVTQAMNGNIGYRIASFFRGAWNVPTMVITYFFAIILASCMAIPPTMHALKMPVTESLRFE